MKQYSQVKSELNSPSKTTEDSIQSIYGPHQDKTQVLKNFAKVLSGLEEEFPDVARSNRAVGLYTAAGRTEIGGNHTDHQFGCVLAASINLESISAASPNNTSIINLFSEGYGIMSVDVSDTTIHEDEFDTTSALLRGFAALLKKAGYKIEGFDAYCTSSVLSGSGLSSSASFESLIGSIMNDMFCGCALSREDIAKYGQKVENEYFGKPCGLMDQMACSVGSVVAIDFADNSNPAVKKVDVDFDEAGYDLVICDTLSSHAELSAAYASIPNEMCQVAAYFGQEKLRGITEAQLIDNAAAIRFTTSDRAFLRALHFVRDNIRAQKEAEQLRNKDIAGFLQTVNESGLSSIEYLQNISTFEDVQTQPVAAALAIAESILAGRGACRVHGGGFAGTIQCFVPHEILGEFTRRMKLALGEDVCHVLSVRPIGCACVI